MQNKIFIGLLIASAMLFFNAVMLYGEVEEGCALKGTEKEKAVGVYHKGRMMHMMHMMHRKIIATEDGGVIVMVGNKLLKYDKDLNLIKKVEITRDAMKHHTEEAESYSKKPETE